MKATTRCRCPYCGAFCSSKFRGEIPCFACGEWFDHPSGAETFEDIPLPRLIANPYQPGLF